MAVSDDIDNQIGTLLATPPPAGAPSTPQAVPSASSDPIERDIGAALAGKLPPPQQTPEEQQNLTRAVGAGTASAAVAGTLGLPVDVPRILVNALPAAANQLGRDVFGYDPQIPLIPSDLPGSAAAWNRQLGKIGLGTEAYPPTTPGERYAQAVGEGIGSTLTPNILGKARLATKLLGEGAGLVEEALAPKPAEPETPGLIREAGRAIGPAAVGTVSGVGGEAGHDIAPAGYEETGRVIGQSLGGLSAAGVTDALAPPVARAAWEHVPAVLPGARTAAAQDLATQQYAASGARLEELALGAGPEATKAHIQGLLDENDRLRAIDQAGAEGQAAAARERVEPRMSPEEQGAAATEAMRAVRSPAQQTLEDTHRDVRQALDEASAHLGGVEAMGTPEEQAAASGAYGARMRDPAQTAYDNEKARLQALVNSIPKGMGVNADPIRAAVTDIGQRFRFARDTFSGDEKGFYDRIANWGDQVPFEDAIGLRQDINERLSKTLDHKPREQLRLMTLKHGVDEALTSPSPSRPPPPLTEAQQWAVQRLGIPDPGGGELPPLTPEAQQTFADFNRGWAEMEHTYQGQTAGKRHVVGDILHKGGAYDSYYHRDDEVPWLLVGPKGSPEAVDRFLAATAGSPDAAEALSDAFAFSARRAAQRPDGSWDNKALQKWIDTNQDKMTRVPGLLDKFNTVGKAQVEVDRIQSALAQHEADFPLKPGLNNAEVLKKYWKPGAEGEAAMRRYAQETGNDPKARAAAIDYAAYQYINTRGMIKTDGTIDPVVSDRWVAQHGGKLDALGARDLFSNPGAAQRVVQEVIDRHLERRAQIADDVAGLFIQDHPYKAMSRLFTGDAAGTENARHLMEITKGNPLAQEGVQRAAIDFIRREYEDIPAERATHGQLTPRFNQFVERNRDTLNVLFPKTARLFDTIAADVHPAVSPGWLRGLTPWLTGTLGGLAAEAVPHLLGHALPIPGAGFATGVAYPIVRQWSQHNIKVKAGQILNDMLKDPELADKALSARKAQPNVGANVIRNQFFSKALALALQAARGDDLTPTPQPPDRRPDTLTMAPGQGHRAGERVRRQSGGDTQPARLAIP